MQPIQLNSTDYYDKARSELSSANTHLNVFEIPEIQKISINAGVGKLDANQKSQVVDYLRKLTGQEPKQRESKVSIAGFNLRKGTVNGVICTLRGKKMKDFLLNLVYIALPRTRDFKGISKASMDKAGKVYSLGIENASIFPTIGFDSTVQFGFQINIVFKYPSPLNQEFLTKLNFPFKKSE